MARILVIDDDEFVRIYHQTVLERGGHEVVLAPGGKEALEFFSNGNFDLAVTDFEMDPMNGVEVIKKIKEQKPNFPVIMVTSAPPKKHGADALLDKSTPSRLLLDKVKFLLGK